MDAPQIQKLLQEHLSDCQIQVLGVAGKYELKAIGDVFQGLTAVKRQQKIYSILNPYISDGSIHAVTMKLLTHAEAQQLPH